MRTRPPDFELTDDAGLYRPAAMHAARPGQVGEIVLLPGASSRWLALAALLLVLAIGLLVARGSWTRRSTVAGQLVPRDGLIRISAAQPGVVVERHAIDGQQVKKGELLFVISGDRAGPDRSDYQRGIADQIQARRRSLELELGRIDAAEAQEVAQMRRREESMRAEQAVLVNQAELNSTRASGAADAHARYQDLFRQGFVSRDVLLARETELAEAQSRIQVQQRDKLVLEREIAATRRELDGVRTRLASQRAELQRAILQVRQEFAEAEARRQVMVAAPADGRLTLVQADIGQVVDIGRALAQLVPASSLLISRLYAPSRAAGFVRPGDAVLLRYDAFPYQKFGQHAGQVLSVSQAAVAAAELQGLSIPAAATAEPLFAITVALPAQQMQPGAIPLYSGMRVEADLLHETRRLYEWMLEPLLVARARMRDS